MTADTGLEAFFIGVANKDADLLDALRGEPDFAVEEGRWCFTLPGLYRHLCRCWGQVELGDYRAFRRRLFRSTVNRSLAGRGARIVIVENRKSVDSNRYALVWEKRTE